ncbi:MAG: CHAT domain-containing protein [Gemmatimonas sp.]
MSNGHEKPSRAAKPEKSSGTARANSGARASGGREYLDLSIELRDIDSAADTCVVTVLPSVVGETDPVSVPLRMDELKQDLARLERKNITESKLMALGERLGDRLLPVGEVRDRFKVALARAGRVGGVRLRLVIRDARLAQLPWEFAYMQGVGTEKHRSGFLLLNPQISMVRHEAMSEEPWPLVASDRSRLRLVVATANVTSTNIAGLGEFELSPLDLDLERDAITNAVKDLTVDGVTVDADRLLEHATAADVTKALLPGADVFHFAGHGYMATAESDPGAQPSALGGFILLHTDAESDEGVPMRADDLAMTLQRAGVRLAMLGACESARRDGGSAWNAVAPALVRRGLPAAVAMQYEVEDDRATAFTRMMYTAIASGLSLDEAVSAGRQAMLGDGQGKSIEWGVPVLYMRSTSGVLFPEIVDQPSETGEKLRLVINQVVDTIAKGGEVVGVDAHTLESGSFEVTMKAGVVKGTMIGVRVGRVGATRAPREDVENE